MMANSVFLVFHTHAFDDDSEDVKLLGVFSTKGCAENAMSNASELPGFRDCVEGFHIEEYHIDRMEWTEGYVTV